MRIETIQRLDDALTRARPEMDENGKRICTALYRLLAKGGPVAPETLAEATGLPPTQVEDQLSSWPGVFRDDSEHIIGFWGLALREMPHRFTVGGRTLHNWCAWDALFIPELLGETARYEGRCPVTGEPIRLTISPEGIEEVNPAATVISFLTPDEKFGNDVITRFCHHIHFFASQGAAESWTADRPGHLILTLEEAFEVGRRQNRARGLAVADGG